MTFGSLFAGIGGMDLGLERAGMKCVWQVEIDDYATRVLEKHWPAVRRHGDVRTFPPEPAAEWRCDLICGGFPCQDISNAGHKEGINGRRSGLWGEFARIIRTLRPRYVIVENVDALLVRGMGRVLGDLAACGYDAEWSMLSACAFSLPHVRERVFIIAYPKGGGWTGAQDSLSRFGLPHDGKARAKQAQQIGGCVSSAGRDWWISQPGLACVHHGLSAKVVDSPNRRVGNAVVPQVAEWIGRLILQSDLRED